MISQRGLVFLVISTITLLSLVAALTPVSAQSLEGLGAMSLTISPSLPRPNSTVAVTLNAFSLDMTNATINWYVNGVEQNEAKNQQRMTIATGDVGKKMTVRAVVTPHNGSPISVTKSFIPAAIDVVIESDTTAPTFYKGRKLPGQGSPVRITVLPFDGSDSDPSSFTYKWQLNQETLFNGPVRGKYTADITMPDYQNAFFSVEVTAADGSYIGKRTMSLSGVKPELQFYEVNPLRGESRRAVGDTLTLLGDETSVRAEPYFVNKGIADAGGQYTWELNGEKVDNGNSDSHLITFRTTGGEGNASVNFSMINTNQLSQFVSGSFNVAFQ